MIALAGKRAFWKNNAFWIVGMPTILIGFVFLVAFVAKALG